MPSVDPSTQPSTESRKDARMSAIGQGENTEVCASSSENVKMPDRIEETAAADETAAAPADQVPSTRASSEASGRTLVDTTSAGDDQRVADKRKLPAVEELDQGNDAGPERPAKKRKSSKHSHKEKEKSGNTGVQRSEGRSAAVKSAKPKKSSIASESESPSAPVEETKKVKLVIRLSAAAIQHALRNIGNEDDAGAANSRRGSASADHGRAALFDRVDEIFWAVRTHSRHFAKNAESFQRPGDSSLGHPSAGFAGTASYEIMPRHDRHPHGQTPTKLKVKHWEKMLLHRNLLPSEYRLYYGYASRICAMKRVSPLKDTDPISTIDRGLAS
ncbi:hypothetical protein BV25DRAFT_1837576 [Artomyces pyxidatus]|uniref:Uncharacterized protein n=1 Tax=Artomyces pyxidatus TaxID=48021 RepID=A0ACB8T4C8_9AGAM|nr:hypothetical protein BV25DRAFT_1837576 [Artomyces pyxidatus]